MFKRVLILLLLLVVALGLFTNMTTAQTVPTATPIFTAAASPTVYYLTTPLPSPTPGCAAPLGLVAGATAYVRGGVYVRSQPSASSPWVNYYTEAVTVTIVDGPVCDGSRYNWWQVRGPGNDGWVAEGTPAEYFMSVGALPGGTTCGASVSLTAGEQALTLRDLRVHDSPSESGLVLTVAPINTQITVLEGPRCAEEYNWWRIRVTVVNVVYTGWVADGEPDGEDYLISLAASVPTPVCYSPLNLAIGSQAYVDYDDKKPKNLRAAPDLESELIASLLDGIGFEVIGGPACADALNWWQIRILSRPDVTGWLAEGGPGNYWISPIKIDDRPL